MGQGERLARLDGKRGGASRAGRGKAYLAGRRGD